MEIITKLEATRTQTLPYFELSDAQLNSTYAPGKWPVRVILHHIVDTETVFYDRIRRVISEPGQVQWAFDQDAWAAGLDYARMPLELSRHMYEAVRACVIHQARLHYDVDGAREFVHSIRGTRTLKSVFDYVVSHNEHHVAQIERALQSTAL